MDAPVLTGMRLAADPDAWAGAGFSVERGGCRVGGVELALEGGGGGISGWALSGVGAQSIDGLPTSSGEDPAAAGDAHENGVVGIDHVVVLTPELERTVAALEEHGIALRRRREGETGMGTRRQAFFRVGQPILELVEAPELGEGSEARFWGITFTTADLDGAADLLGERLGRVKDAVQPGRRIATVRREAGLGLPVALISAQG